MMKWKKQKPEDDFGFLFINYLLYRGTSNENRFYKKKTSNGG